MALLMLVLGRRLPRGGGVHDAILDGSMRNSLTESSSVVSPWSFAVLAELLLMILC